MRRPHNSRRTDNARLHWIRRFLLIPVGENVAAFTAVQPAAYHAAQRTGPSKRVITHAFHHSFATHLLEGRYDIRTVQIAYDHQVFRDEVRREGSRHRTHLGSSTIGSSKTVVCTGHRIEFRLPNT